MRITPTLLYAVLAFTATSDAKLFGKDKPVYEDWSLDQSLEFLKAQGVAIRDSKNLAAIQSQVAENADAAATWGAKAAGVGQAYYEVGSKVVGDAWTESQLREWLLEQGVVSPQSNREQLLVLAKQKASAASTAIYGHPTDQAASSVSSAYGQASQTPLLSPRRQATLPLKSPRSSTMLRITSSRHGTTTSSELGCRRTTSSRRLSQLAELPY